MSNSFSRRTFLKAIGATAIASSASRLIVPQTVTASILADAQDFNKATEIAQKSAELQRILESLSNQGFGFDFKAGSLLRSDQTKLIGLEMSSVRNPNPNDGANVIITIDLDSQTVAFVESKIAKVSDATAETTTLSLDVSSLKQTTQSQIVDFSNALDDGSVELARPEQSLLEPKGGIYTPQESCVPSGWRETRNVTYRGCLQTSFCCCTGGCGYKCTKDGWRGEERYCTRSTYCVVTCGGWQVFTTENNIPCC